MLDDDSVQEEERFIIWMLTTYWPGHQANKVLASLNRHKRLARCPPQMSRCPTQMQMSTTMWHFKWNAQILWRHANGYICHVACSTYGIPLASTAADALDHPNNVNKDAGPCGDVHALHHPFHTWYGQSSQKFLVGLYLGFMHVHALRRCSSPQLTSMRFVARDYGFVHRGYLLGASPMTQYISRLARVTASCIIGVVYRWPKTIQFFGPFWAANLVCSQVLSSNFASFAPLSSASLAASANRWGWRCLGRSLKWHVFWTRFFRQAEYGHVMSCRVFFGFGTHIFSRTSSSSCLFPVAIFGFPRKVGNVQTEVWNQTPPPPLESLQLRCEGRSVTLRWNALDLLDLPKAWMTAVVFGCGCVFVWYLHIFACFIRL